MGKPQRFGDLEAGYDPGHEEREWIVQRIGWAVMALLIAAALAGLLGPGPLSKRHAGKMGSPLHVEYQRFGRYQAPGELRVYCRPEGEQFRITVDRGFIQNSEITRIMPEPIETILELDAQSFVFRREGVDDHLVTFRFESQQFGQATTRIILDKKESVEIRQFYWP